MKGQWICLSTTLLLSQLIETPSFMMICALCCPAYSRRHFFFFWQCLIGFDLSWSTTRTDLLEIRKRIEDSLNRSQKVWNQNMREMGASKKSSSFRGGVTKIVGMNNRLSQERGRVWQRGHSLQGPPRSELPPCRKQMCTQCRSNMGAQKSEQH